MVLVPQADCLQGLRSFQGFVCVCVCVWGGGGYDIISEDRCVIIIIIVFISTN